MIFLTYNDTYSGIYQSQVIDVCKIMSDKLNRPVTLIALVSIRTYRRERNLIKEVYPQAVVLPMIPKVQFWRLNSILLNLSRRISGTKTIWARGPYACNLALALKRRKKIHEVIFDARGAYEAELTEYDVTGSEQLKKSIHSVEENALRNSDKQLAVSRKLVDWWKSNYNFTPFRYEVIPCTLAEVYEKKFPAPEKLTELRRALGYKSEDCVFVYSGSSAGWQSFKLVEQFLLDEFRKNALARLLFLSNDPPLDSVLFKEYAERIQTKWVKPSEVRSILLAADHGLVVREKSVTNKVASPVKFAEYLACGLKVIISEEIGDFSEFVTANSCGNLFTDQVNYKAVDYGEKKRNRELAGENFSKSSAHILQSYKSLLE